MSFSLIPDFRFQTLADISPEFLRERGIRLLMMDLDNTISPYRVNDLADDISDWIIDMKSAGIRLFIVSNNRGDRPRLFSELMDVPFLKLARKPSRKVIRKAMALEGATEAESALVGDQIYTDVFGANRAGITSLLIEPVLMKNPLHIVRYGLEAPFRFSKKKMKRRVR